MLNVERWNIQVWYYSLWTFFFFILTSYLLVLMGYILAEQKADARNTRPMSEEVVEILDGHLKVRSRPFAVRLMPGLETAARQHPMCCFAQYCCKKGMDRPCPLRLVCFPFCLCPCLTVCCQPPGLCVQVSRGKAPAIERLQMMISSAADTDIFELKRQATSFFEMRKQLQARNITLMLLHLQTSGARLLGADDIEGIILELEKFLGERPSPVHQQPCFPCI